MLVLTRKRGEQVTIGASVAVRILHTGHGSVRLGIAAPPHIRVRRAEKADSERWTDSQEVVPCFDPHSPSLVSGLMVGGRLVTQIS